MTRLLIEDLLHHNALGHAAMRAVRGGYLNGVSLPPWPVSLPPAILDPFTHGPGIGVVHPVNGTDIDPGYSPQSH
jgi:hypothetical protein